MRIHSLAAYYPNSAHARIAPRTPSHWESYKFCQSVKSGITQDPFVFPWKHTSENISAGDTVRARAIFGQFIRKKIFDCGIRNPIVVPLPSKDGLSNRRDFRSYQMVREALQGDLDYPVVPALRFTERLSPASLGGPRDPATLYSMMDIIGDVPRGGLVLVDDVMTTGSSIKAAIRRLAESNMQVTTTIVCGHTVYKAGTPAFGDHQIQLQLNGRDLGSNRPIVPTWHWL